MDTTKKIDHISNLRAFLAAWDKPALAQNRAAVDLHVTGFGNINSTGVPGNYMGPLLTRWHPQFEASLEDGVKQLVQILVGKLGWISYTSCEGHPYPGADLPPGQRNVGLVARSPEEARDMESVLRTCCEEVHRLFPAAPVHVEVFVHEIEGDGFTAPAVDLIFHRIRSRTWEEYFLEIDRVTEALIQALAVG